MKLKKLTLKNIRSYKSQEVIFPQGSTLLAGDIGAGKTTVLLAIEFALFGLQPGQRGSSLLANGEEEGLVVLECDIEGNAVVIERRLRKGSKTISHDYAGLTLNGHTNELSVTELKTKILELLGYPEEFIKKTNLLYRYTVYAPQEEMKQIILEDAETRLDILRHIFGIDKYRKIKDNLLIVNAHLRERARTLQFEIRDIESHKSRLNEGTQSLIALEVKLKESDTLVVHAKSKRKSFELELEALKEKLTEKQRFEKEIEKANILFSNKMQYLSDYDRESKKVRESLAEVKETFDSVVYETLIKDISAGKKESEALNKHFIEISTSLNSILSKKQDDMEKKKRIFSIDICPTCLQDVSDGHKHNIVNETESRIAKAEREILELTKEREKTKVLHEQACIQLDKLEKKRSELEILRITTQNLEAKKTRLRELEGMHNLVVKDVESLKQHLLALKQSVLEFSKFDTLSRLKEEELKKAFAEEKRVEIALAELKKEREFMLKEQERIARELEKKEASRAYFIKVQELEKWLSEDFSKLVSFVERNIMLKVREEFSRLFNKWFALLTTDAFSVQLDEHFTPIILQGEYELDYEFLSGGERTAVALAYRLALNQILNSIHSRIKTRDLIILDEPTDGFSEPQLDKVRDILRELNVQQLIIVSHEQKIESFVDTIIRIKKDGGYSMKE